MERKKKNPTWFLAVKGGKIRKPMAVSPQATALFSKVSVTGLAF